MSAAAVQSHETLLEAYPARSGVDWDVIDGRAVLAVPKRFGWIERLTFRFFPGPEVAFVRLDELGTEAWLALDGTRSGRDVARRLQETFQERAEPAEERAVKFLAGLLARGYARAFDQPHEVEDSGRGFTLDKGFREVPCTRCARPHPMKAPAGARYVCPHCRRISRVPPENHA